jgi:hypothetical protein
LTLFLDALAPILKCLLLREFYSFKLSNIFID